MCIRPQRNHVIQTWLFGSTFADAVQNEGLCLPAKLLLRDIGTKSRVVPTTCLTPCQLDQQLRAELNTIPGGPSPEGSD